MKWKRSNLPDDVQNVFTYVMLGVAFALALAMALGNRLVNYLLSVCGV